MPQIQPLSSCGEPPLQKKISICFILPCRLLISLRLFCFSRLASRRGTGTSLSLLPPSLIGGSLRKSYCTMSTTAQSSSFLLFATRLSPREENPAAKDRLCAFTDTISSHLQKTKGSPGLCDRRRAFCNRDNHEVRGTSTLPPLCAHQRALTGAV